MRPVKVYIIDDEISICEACSIILSEQKYETGFNRTGSGGLWEVLDGQWDMVLLDMKLPDIDGLRILEELSAKKPEIMVIVMTGYSTVENAVDAMKSGAFDYLRKPFTDDVLLMVVEKALAKKRLMDENRILRGELLSRYNFSNIVGEDPAMIEVFDRIRKVASLDVTVLVYGESGTGKELVARAIHANSRASRGPFVPVDCSTLANSLLESELFGHSKGAYTGAVDAQAGLLEAAQDGTLFLDEISNLSLEVQAKLLRFLETREFKPVGASRMKSTTARIIAASNRNLAEMVENGTFREDLYYRLNVLPIRIPPLRERKGDIPKLTYHFLRLFSRKADKKIQGFTDPALEMLIQYDWPGNVRQLKNTIERLVIMADKETMDPGAVFENLNTAPPRENKPVPRTADELQAARKRILDETFGKVQKAFLIRALQDSQGNITEAAESAGMKRSNFSALMKKHHLSPEDFRAVKPERHSDRQ